MSTEAAVNATGLAALVGDQLFPPPYRTEDGDGWLAVDVQARIHGQVRRNVAERKISGRQILKWAEFLAKLILTLMR